MYFHIAELRTLPSLLVLECFTRGVFLIISQCASIHDCAVGGHSLVSTEGWVDEHTEQDGGSAYSRTTVATFDHLHRYMLSDFRTRQ